MHSIFNLASPRHTSIHADALGGSTSRLKSSGFIVPTDEGGAQWQHWFYEDFSCIRLISLVFWGPCQLIYTCSISWDLLVRLCQSRSCRSCSQRLTRVRKIKLKWTRGGKKIKLKFVPCELFTWQIFCFGAAKAAHSSHSLRVSASFQPEVTFKKLGSASLRSFA